MASERNRLLNCINYLEAQGIQVNLRKNKARGNKGFFKVQGKNTYTIDVAKNLSDDAALRVLTHEFAHFLHYSFDKSLKNLGFIFTNLDDSLIEEMLALTVDSIPKDTVTPLFNLKTELKKEIDNLKEIILQTYPDFKLSSRHKKIENTIWKTPLKHLLKHDKVKFLYSFTFKIYSVENVEIDFPNEAEYIIAYIKIKSKQRFLKRINNRISRLNQYYNSTTELFARTLEMYVFEKEKTKKLAPNITTILDKVIETNKITTLTKFVEILKF